MNHKSILVVVFLGELLGFCGISAMDKPQIKQRPGIADRDPGIIAIDLANKYLLASSSAQKERAAEYLGNHLHDTKYSTNTSWTMAVKKGNLPEKFQHWQQHNDAKIQEFKIYLYGAYYGEHDPIFICSGLKEAMQKFCDVGHRPSLQYMQQFYKQDVVTQLLLLSKKNTLRKHKINIVAQYIQLSNVDCDDFDKAVDEVCRLDNSFGEQASAIAVQDMPVDEKKSLLENIISLQLESNEYVKQGLLFLLWRQDVQDLIAAWPMQGQSSGGTPMQRLVDLLAINTNSMINEFVQTGVADNIAQLYFVSKNPNLNQDYALFLWKKLKTHQLDQDPYDPALREKNIKFFTQERNKIRDIQKNLSMNNYAQDELLNGIFRIDCVTSILKMWHAFDNSKPWKIEDTVLAISKALETLTDEDIAKIEELIQYPQFIEFVENGFYLLSLESDTYSQISPREKVHNASKEIHHKINNFPIIGDEQQYILAAEVSEFPVDQPQAKIPSVGPQDVQKYDDQTMRKQFATNIMSKLRAAQQRQGQEAQGEEQPVVIEPIDHEQQPPIDEQGFIKQIWNGLRDTVWSGITWLWRNITGIFGGFRG